MKKNLSFLILLVVLQSSIVKGLNVTLAIITNPCNNNGEVQINASGGTAPYSYQFGVWPGNIGVNPILTIILSVV